jgi:hypothetical protein
MPFSGATFGVVEIHADQFLAPIQSRSLTAILGRLEGAVEVRANWVVSGFTAQTEKSMLWPFGGSDAPFS